MSELSIKFYNEPYSRIICLYTSPTWDISFKNLKMPKELNHEQCRAKLCIWCVTRKSDLRPISAAIRTKIVELIPGLDFNDDPRLPNRICTNDRKAIQNAASSRNTLPPKFDYRYLYN